MNKEELIELLATDKDFKYFRAVAEEVFDSKMKDRPVYVKAIKAHDGQPDFYVKLEDVEQVERVT